MNIYLDESGNFKGPKDNYFIVDGFIIGDPKRTAKAFRKWQHTKFPKKLRYKTIESASKELFENYWKNLYKNKRPPQMR